MRTFVLSSLNLVLWHLPPLAPPPPLLRAAGCSIQLSVGHLCNGREAMGPEGGVAQGSGKVQGAISLSYKGPFHVPCLALSAMLTLPSPTSYPTRMPFQCQGVVGSQGGTGSHNSQGRG